MVRMARILSDPLPYSRPIASALQPASATATTCVQRVKIACCQHPAGNILERSRHHRLRKICLLLLLLA